jgi:hypothetical protein
MILDIKGSKNQVREQKTGENRGQITVSSNISGICDLSLNVCPGFAALVDFSNGVSPPTAYPASSAFRNMPGGHTGVALNFSK